MNGSVIVPLYVYPSMGAWGAMYDMYASAISYDHHYCVVNSDLARAATYPRVQFTAVVNIQSGPGDGALPSAEYWDAIGTLNSFENVRTVGYVATTWCERNLSQVLEEIAAYSFWGEYNSALAIDGIFVDETPTQYSTEYLEYLQSISNAIHSSPGLKEGYIVHNPGALPQPEYFEDAPSDLGVRHTPDLTVIFENTFLNWSIQNLQLAEMTASYDRKTLAILLHSVPDLDTISTETVLRQLLAVGHSIWLTGTNNYTRLDTHFPVFVDSLAKLLS